MLYRDACNHDECRSDCLSSLLKSFCSAGQLQQSIGMEIQAYIWERLIILEEKSPALMPFLWKSNALLGGTGTCALVMALSWTWLAEGWEQQLTVQWPLDCMKNVVVKDGLPWQSAWLGCCFFIDPEVNQGVVCWLSVPRPNTWCYLNQLSVKQWEFL